MARVIHRPEPLHSCMVELDLDIGFPQPTGTLAECSCGNRFVFFRRRKKLAWLYEFLNDSLNGDFYEDVMGWEQLKDTPSDL